jgi:hypothetical protein
MLLKLLTLPVTGPLEGVVWLAQQLEEQAAHELYDEGAIRGKLMELELRLELGDMDEDEYDAAEAALLKQLRAAREYHANRR